VCEYCVVNTTCQVQWSQAASGKWSTSSTRFHFRLLTGPRAVVQGTRGTRPRPRPLGLMLALYSCIDFKFYISWWGWWGVGVGVNGKWANAAGKRASRSWLEIYTWIFVCFFCCWPRCSSYNCRFLLAAGSWQFAMQLCSASTSTRGALSNWGCLRLCACVGGGGRRAACYSTRVYVQAAVPLGLTTQAAVVLVAAVLGSRRGPSCGGPGLGSGVLLEEPNRPRSRTTLESRSSDDTSEEAR
jgi:hypothetical protein